MYHFSDIIGEDRLTGHLRETIRSGKLSHAYILTGPKGSGKMMLAETFAACLCCTGRGESGDEPCGECLSCIQAEGHNHPDIVYVQHEKPRTISVNDIRSLREDTAIRPYQSSHKVYIMEDADLMNPAAQNALLKTLEEPPSYVCILLLAQSEDQFLPTIQSRCVHLRMQPVAEPLVEDYLRSTRGVEPGWARICAGFSSGSIGRAVSLATDETFRERREAAVKLMRGIHTADTASLAAFAQEAAKDTAVLDETAEFIRMWCRDVMRCAAAGDTDSLFYADEDAAIFEESLKLSPGDIGRVMDALEEYDYRMRYNASAAPALTSLLLKIRDAGSKE